MVLGTRIFKDLANGGNGGTIVPVVFPLVAGAGSLTTILTLKAEFSSQAIMVGIVINLIIVFLVLKSINWLSRILSPGLLHSLEKVFGILLIAIAFQMMKNVIVETLAHSM